MGVTLYSTQTCPNCIILKEFLGKENIIFKELNMRLAEVAAQLFSDNVYCMQAPILKIDNTYHVNITEAGKLNLQLVKSLINKEVKIQ